ncbi:MAG: DNA recombination protein RmuC, partial [Acidobacteriaceae bacterium]
LEQQLADRASALESAQRDRETARQDLTAQQQTDAERDAKQREEIARLTAQRGSSEQDAAQAANAVEELRAEITRLGNHILESETERASLRTTLESEQKNTQEKIALLTEARAELSNQFKALAGDILKENSKAFTEQNQTNIGHLLNPLKEKFEEFQKEVKNLNDDGLKGRTELKKQIDDLAKFSTKLSDDANNLATALKGSSKTQGDWGEIVLERILEASGLRKGHEYRMQESFTLQQQSEEGRLRARLDVIVDLPEGRHIVLDSKVSLNGYNDYCAATEDTARADALSRHLDSVRKHIRDLAKRDYCSLYEIQSLDFVVMFVPIEPAFTLALSSDEKLWKEAWDRNVLLVSRTSLLFVLRTVAHLWRQEWQTKNVQEIKNRGGELYDKLVGFATDLMDLGTSLEEARSSYDEAIKKLATGKGNAIRQAEMLKNLGAETKKKLPPMLVELAVESAPLELAASMEETEA